MSSLIFETPVNHLRLMSRRQLKVWGSTFIWVLHIKWLSFSNNYRHAYIKEWIIASITIYIPRFLKTYQMVWKMFCSIHVHDNEQIAYWITDLMLWRGEETKVNENETPHSLKAYSVFWNYKQRWLQK